jgi:hypothetical protein
LTNGTYVDGELVTEETPLLPGTTVKFGEVAALFEPHDERMEARLAPGTEVMERVDAPAAAEQSPAQEAAPLREPVSLPEPALVPDVAAASGVASASEPAPEAAPAPRPRPRRPLQLTPPRRRGLPGWAVAALCAAAAAAAGVAAAFLFLR